MERYCLWGHYTHALLTEGLGLQDAQLHIGARFACTCLCLPALPARQHTIHRNGPGACWR
jgi:hypothetical protein